MMNTIAYDNANIFARILRGEIPAHKVYEDADTLAFMDIMPRSDGHVLVIPKTPARTLLDIETEALMKTSVIVQKIAIAAKKAMNADGITLEQFNETAGGQVVFHLHFHIIPRFTGVNMRRHTGEMADPDLLMKHAALIRTAIEG